jgi:hypothetical protein
MAPPSGRLSDIDTIVGRTEDGPVTVADRIVNGLRAGAYFEQAVAAAGVAKDTAYGWLRIAGKVRIRARGSLDTIELTHHETNCLRFSDAVAEAEASWEVGALALLEQLARGGIEQLREVVKVDANGTVLERTTTREHTLPSAQVLEWRLERKIPERYGRRVEIGLDAGGPVLSEEERADALVDVFSAYLQGVEDAKAVKVTKPRRKRQAQATPAS